MKPTRLSRYIAREVALAWAAIAVVLLAVMVSNRLVRYLGEAIAGEVPADVVFVLLGYKAVASLSVVLPGSLFLAMVLTFGRLYRDSEMFAMAGCGAGPAQLYRALALVSLPATALVAALALVLAPWAEAQVEHSLAEARRDMEFQVVAPGRFIEVPALDGMAYAGGFEEGPRELFAQGRANGRLVVVVADRASQSVDPDTGERFLVLRDGVRYEGLPGEGEWRVLEFAEHGVRLTPSPVQVSLHRRALPTAELWGDPRPRYVAELQWRISMALTLPVLTLIAVPLSRAPPRSGRYGRLVVAALVFVLYMNGLTTAQDTLRDAQVPGWIGLWWVHLAALAVGLAWLQWSYRLLARVRR